MPVAIRGVRTASIAVLALLAALVVGGAIALMLPSSSGSDAQPPPRRAPMTAAPAALKSSSLAGLTPCQRLEIGRRKRLLYATGSGRRVLVIGDSWSSGAKLPPGDPAWPSFLHGRVSVDGVPGSGFSEAALGCAGLAYGDRVASALAELKPDLVVVQGGLNDADVPDAEIRQGFYRLALALGDRKVVVLGPATAPARRDEVARVDHLLGDLSRSAGYRYVSLLDLSLHYLPDGLHLHPAGHRVVGEYAAEHIAG